MKVGATEPTPDRSEPDARVRRLEFNGPELLATLAVGPHRLIARLPANQALEDGQRVEAVLDLRKSVWFDQTTGEAAVETACGSFPLCPGVRPWALRRQSIQNVQNPLELSFDLGQSLLVIRILSDSPILEQVLQIRPKLALSPWARSELAPILERLL